MLSLLRLCGLTLWMIGALAGEGILIAGVVCSAIVVVADQRGKLWRPSIQVLAAFILYEIVSSRWAVRPLATGAPWSVVHWTFFPVAIAIVRLTPRVDWLVRIARPLLIVSGALCFLQASRSFEWPLAEFLERVVPLNRSDEPSPYFGFRSGGLWFHRLKYAHTLVPMLIALWPWLRQTRAGITSVVLSLGGMILAVVSAAWGSLLIAIAAARFPRRAWLVIVPAIGWPFVGWFPRDRAVAWHTALDLFRAHPLDGVGAGGYPQAALAAYGGESPAELPLIYLDAHSLLLQVLAEGGALAMLLFAVMVFFFLRWAPPRTPRAWAVLTSFVVLSTVHNLAYHPGVLGAFALAYAISLLPSAPASDRTPHA